MGERAVLTNDPCYPNGGGVGHCVKELVCCAPGPPPNAPSIADIADVAITREDSLAAGNCQGGTDWVASWFPGRQSVPAREAAETAIARGKPRLARYIARTALLVDRAASAHRLAGIVRHGGTLEITFTLRSPSSNRRNVPQQRQRESGRRSNGTCHRKPLQLA